MKQNKRKQLLEEIIVLTLNFFILFYFNAKDTSFHIYIHIFIYGNPLVSTLLLPTKNKQMPYQTTDRKYYT